MKEKMKKKVTRCFSTSRILFLLFALLIWTVLNVDVQTIGPEGSSIGIATINQFVHEKIGVHIIWYHITDWLGVVAIFTAFGFAVVGLVQLIKRKSLLKVDRSVIALGIYFIIVIGLYVLFEIWIVNYRPIIISEGLEASFPSSHTMIVLAIMGAAMIQFNRLMKSKVIRNIANITSVLVIVVTIIGRLISGVHWFTDIIGGVILGMALIILYRGVVELLENQSGRRDDMQTNTGDGKNRRVTIA